MTLANRLTAGKCRDNLVVVQLGHAKFQPRQFLSALRVLEALLYRVAKSSEGVVLVSPFGIEHGTGIHLLSPAENIDRAKYLAGQATRVLTGKLSDTHDVTAQPFIGDLVAPAEAIVVH